MPYPETIPLKPSLSPSGTNPRLERLISRARMVLLWEKIWPSIALSALCVLAFLMLGWFGFWEALPPVGRIAGVVLFVLAALYCLVPLLRVHRPSRAEALARIDAASGLAHHPANGMDDRLALTEDPLTKSLWHIHRARLLKDAEKLQVGQPQPNLVAYDPFGVRAALILLAGVAFFMSGAERAPRLMAAFEWEGWRTVAVPPRVDVWVTPPAYTGKPPLFLNRDAAQSNHFTVPQGSILVARVSEGALRAHLKGGIRAAAQAEEAALQENQWSLESDGAISLWPETGKTLYWSFTVTPDAPPTISFTDTPKANLRGGLQLNYTVADDYRVAEASVAITQSQNQKAPLLAQPLYEPPSGLLQLPANRTRSGKAHTTLDLAAHPWAGSEVQITPVARDDKGQEGRGKTITTLLPQRRFNDPVARALVDLRRMLALDRNARPRVETGLDALTLFADDFNVPASTYLGLRSAYWRLINANDDDALRGVVDYLWEMALHLEEGEMSTAARDLQAAQEALKEALERGASDEEIKQLTQQLREAMSKFLTEMARQAARNPQSAMPSHPDTRFLTPQDLEKMLNQLEDLARSGAQDAAQQLLSQLQDIFDSLSQSGQQGQQGQSQAAQEMNKNINELGRIIQDQSRLHDRTFQEQQKQRDPNRFSGEQGSATQSGDEQSGAGEPPPNLSELEQQQQGLQQQLEQLQKNLQGLGLQNPQGFNDAGKAMGSAREELGKGESGRAVQSQAEALNKLREGAKGIMDQLASRSGQGQGQGQQQGMGTPMPSSGQNAGEGVDPLGRPTRSRQFDPGDSVRIPGEIQAQRARKIMEELRRRLSDPQRPALELDYLERLIGR